LFHKTPLIFLLTRCDAPVRSAKDDLTKVAEGVLI